MYDFIPYDVLQIKRSGSVWQDYMTLRTMDEGIRAVSLVKNGVIGEVGPHSEFRITRYAMGQGHVPVCVKE